MTACLCLCLCMCCRGTTLALGSCPPTPLSLRRGGTANQIGRSASHQQPTCRERRKKPDARTFLLGEQGAGSRKQEAGSRKQEVGSRKQRQHDAGSIVEGGRPIGHGGFRKGLLTGRPLLALTADGQMASRQCTCPSSDRFWLDRLRALFAVHQRSALVYLTSKCHRWRCVVSEARV